MAMPQLLELNPNDPNYVSQLDQGVRTLRDLINTELEKLGSLDENFHRRTIQELRGIDGIEVKEMPSVSNETNSRWRGCSKHFTRTDSYQCS